MPRGKLRRISPAPAARETGRQKPSQETEVKLRVSDRDALLQRLGRLRASYEGRVYEVNTLYDTAQDSLRRNGKLLRIRVEQPAGRDGDGAKPSVVGGRSYDALLTFKGPAMQKRSRKNRRARHYKIREEREVRVEDSGVLEEILEALSFRPSFRYEKYRSTYRLRGLSGLKLVLDETPIGDFLEAEGNCAAIDRAARLLGYQPADYITKSYGQLFLETKRRRNRRGPSKQRRRSDLAPRDMLFANST
jgi:adenylate cyclase class 2